METKKETLNTSHIAKRLPYGLKGILTEDKTSIFHEELWFDENESIFQPNAVWELCGYAPKDLMIPLGEGYFDGFLWRSGTTYVNFHRGILPVMFPLNSLTETITIKGESFVPIEVLKSNSETPYASSFRLEENNFVFDTQLMDSSYGAHKWEDVTLYCGNQLEMFEKLIEWHFDLPHENLIEKGLAISVLDLDKNPYNQ